MSAQSYDAIVIGAGVIGNAITCELARRGWRVVGVDRNPGAGQGSTSSSSAIVRFTYSTRAGVAMSYEGLQYWLDWPQHIGDCDEAGYTTFTQCGMLTFISGEGPHLLPVPHFDELGVPYEIWDRDEAVARLGFFDLSRFGPPRQIGDPDFWAEPTSQLEGALWTPGDHRRLAAELDLVSWPNELGPGLAVWHPKGALVRTLMEDYSRQRHAGGGYQFVFSPHIAKGVLWETSGHLDFYAESMYPPMEMDGTDYYPKPMNCPFHVMVYRSSQRSYRELPMRLFELGAVYRYELSGAVHGLLRSRGFTQDDAHIFCAREHIAEELASLLEFSLSVLEAFGFSEFQARLSTRPADKYVGEEALWDDATVGLRAALTSAGLDYETDEGGGAFYGPKIDVDVRDAIGRSWQLSTIQVDFNLPERFGLEYVASDGSRPRPVMIHRALFGSVERFFGVLVEHYAGAFPAWLAPVQAAVLPVAAAHADYAAEVAGALLSRGFRTEVSPAEEPLGKRVRNAKVAKVPYVLVVGDDDTANGTVGVNARGAKKPERDVPLEAFAARLAAEVEARS